MVKSSFLLVVMSLNTFSGGLGCVMDGITRKGSVGVACNSWHWYQAVDGGVGY